MEFRGIPEIPVTVYKTPQQELEFGRQSALAHRFTGVDRMRGRPGFGVFPWLLVLRGAGSPGGGFKPLDLPLSGPTVRVNLALDSKGEKAYTQDRGICCKVTLLLFFFLDGER
jgi:hypothetical protein